MERHIKSPIDKERAKELRAGDYVYLTGTIYTARDAAHKRMDEALERGEELPLEQYLLIEAEDDGHMTEYRQPSILEEMAGMFYPISFLLR